MADEPLDINDWLTSSNGTVREPEPADDVPVEALKEAVQSAQARLPTVAEAVAVSAQWRAEGAQLEQTGFDTDLDRLRNDVRAVGDRVTLVYESVNALTQTIGEILAVLYGLEQDAAPEEVKPEPKQRRRSKRQYADDAKQGVDNTGNEQDPAQE